MLFCRSFDIFLNNMFCFVLQIKLVDSNNVVVPIGEQGELCVRGWTVFKQYLHDEELTTRAKDISKNGWYHYGYF
jgi:fatty-acyl-CoA synthase